LVLCVISINDARSSKYKIQDDVLRVTDVVMTSTLVRWVGHVARVGCRKCKKILKAGDQLGDLGKDRRIILM